MMNALETVNEHYTVIIEKNIAAICDKYYPSEDTYVILEGPRLTTIGVEKIKTGWMDFCNSPLKLHAINWTEGPFSEETAQMAWVSGIIHLKIQVNETAFENTFRASFVLVKHNDSWKIKHEHVSIADPDPYGIGDWKK
jgi:ketosteroid isomerase-like protein